MIPPGFTTGMAAGALLVGKDPELASEPTCNRRGDAVDDRAKLSSGGLQRQNIPMWIATLHLALSASAGPGKSSASSFGQSNQLLRLGGPQPRYRAVRDADRAAIVVQQQLAKAAGCSSPDDAAAVHEAPSSSSPARAAAGPSRANSQRCRELVLGYRTRAPPVAA